jgi:hypothetical protein
LAPANGEDEEKYPADAAVCRWKMAVDAMKMIGALANCPHDKTLRRNRYSPLMRDPAVLNRADVFLLESTYGDRERANILRTP